MKHFSSLPSLSSCPRYRDTILQRALACHSLRLSQGWVCSSATLKAFVTLPLQGMCYWYHIVWRVKAWLLLNILQGTGQHHNGESSSPGCQKNQYKHTTRMPSCTLKQILGNGFVVNFRLQSMLKGLPPVAVWLMVQTGS